MTRDLAGCSVVMIEDDEVFGRALTQRLRLASVATHWARTATEGEALLRRHRPTLVLCDVRLPDGDGEELVARLMPELGGVPVVVMTAYGGFEQAVRLVQAGADDYLVKPFSTQRVLEKLEAFTRRKPVEEDDPVAMVEAAGWRSPVMRVLQVTLERVAATGATALLTGESGAGKGVAARRVHALGGSRAAAPFIVVDCAALPAETSEAEATLFGRGEAPGLVEAAGEGTLFLDEIGELAPALQPRLLRLLEDRRFQRVGSPVAVAMPARILAATHSDLPARVADGAFRSDLWFRLFVLVLEVPPLRRRRGDIEDLARHFVAHFSRSGLEIAADGMAALLSHAWPGNVRELRNRVERAVLLSDGTVLGAGDFFPERYVATQATGPPENEPAEAGEETTKPLTLADARDAAERQHIRRMLARCGGRIGDAAAALGVSRTTLWERMRRLGLNGR